MSPVAPDAAPAIDVVAGILWRDGRLLAVRRPPGKAMAGFWEFPGGKIEPNETPPDALVRELREELDVVARQFSFWKEILHAYEQLTVRLLFFHVVAFTGEPQALEGQTLAWLTPEEAARLPFLEADLDVVAALGK